MQGITAYNGACRHLLACLPVLLHDPVALLSLEDLDADGFFIEDAHAVRTKVDVTRLRVLQHHEYRGAEVSAAVGERVHGVVSEVERVGQDDAQRLERGHGVTEHRPESCTLLEAVRLPIEPH
jgi:hypothetical protein